jgi:hypothetical protein
MPRLRPGQPPLIPSAAAWNRHEDVSEWYHRNKARGEGSDAPFYLTPSDVVQVRNDSGADRRPGEVLECKEDDPLLTDPPGVIDPENLWFKGATPTGLRAFGVLLFPAKHDATESNRGVTPLQVSGVCKALVNITSATHRFAKVSSGSFVLQSAFEGPVRILGKSAAGTGEKECCVVITGAPPSGVAYNIRFFIISADPLTRSVLAAIIAWSPANLSMADLPGQGNPPGVVNICDPHGCIFNEPAGELVGRTGTATWRQPDIGQALPCQPAGYDTEPQWEADTLCCPTPACDQGA